MSTISRKESGASISSQRRISHRESYHLLCEENERLALEDHDRYFGLRDVEDDEDDTEDEREAHDDSEVQEENLSDNDVKVLPSENELTSPRKTNDLNISLQDSKNKENKVDSEGEEIKGPQHRKEKEKDESSIKLDLPPSLRKVLIGHEFNKHHSWSRAKKRTIFYDPKTRALCWCKIGTKRKNKTNSNHRKVEVSVEKRTFGALFKKLRPTKGGKSEYLDEEKMQENYTKKIHEDATGDTAKTSQSLDRQKHQNTIDRYRSDTCIENIPTPRRTNLSSLSPLNLIEKASSAYRDPLGSILICDIQSIMIPHANGFTMYADRPNNFQEGSTKEQGDDIINDLSDAVDGSFFLQVNTMHRFLKLSCKSQSIRDDWTHLLAQLCREEVNWYENHLAQVLQTDDENIHVTTGANGLVSTLNPLFKQPEVEDQVTTKLHNNRSSSTAPKSDKGVNQEEENSSGKRDHHHHRREIGKTEKLYSKARSKGPGTSTSWAQCPIENDCTDTTSQHRFSEPPQNPSLAVPPVSILDSSQTRSLFPSLVALVRGFVVMKHSGPKQRLRMIRCTPDLTAIVWASVNVISDGWDASALGLNSEAHTSSSTGETPLMTNQSVGNKYTAWRNLSHDDCFLQQIRGIISICNLKNVRVAFKKFSRKDSKRGSEDSTTNAVLNLLQQHLAAPKNSLLRILNIEESFENRSSKTLEPCICLETSERDPMFLECASVSQARALSLSIMILVWLSYHPRNGAKEAFLYYLCNNLEAFQIEQLNLEPFRDHKLHKGTRRCDIHWFGAEKEFFLNYEMR
eukprot:g846.t1